MAAAPPGPTPQAHPFGLPGQQTRLRVSVKLSVRDPNLLIARALYDGEPPPPGTREAILLLLEEPEPPQDGNAT